jgi:hypothetical protein
MFLVSHWTWWRNKENVQDNLARKGMNIGVGIGAMTTHAAHS